MELFSVKRYEDADGTNKSPETDNLQHFLEKIEVRKRKKKACTFETTRKLLKSDTGNEEPSDFHKETSPFGDDPVAADDDNDNVASVEADFAVLGADNDFQKGQKSVDMVLPDWLAHPTIISMQINEEEKDTSASLPSFLATHIQKALKKMKVTRLFPVQSTVIPWLLNAHSKPPPFRPRDICVSAPTGSGKTLAFAIPIVQLLATRVEPRIRALVVLPVAELALQVFKVFKLLCDKTDLAVCLLTQQFPLALEQERLVEEYKGRYHSKVDIVVTTPGRLVDHIHSTKGFCLKALKYLVIDEADRIMDAVFQNWLYHLNEHVRTTSDHLLSGRVGPLCYNELLMVSSKQPHKLLFSATLSQDPEKLQDLRLFQPKLFTSVLTDINQLREQMNQDQTNYQITGDFVGKYTTPAELTEKFCITESRLKPLTLFSLIMENNWTKFLCFTNSGESASRLAFVLGEMFKGKLKISELSAKLKTQNRVQVLSNFARGTIKGLICSDALARGIDIPDVDIVISYDPPRHITTYIHRIGRTARAGRPGTAITLLNQKEFSYFNKSLIDVGKNGLSNEITVSPDMEEQHATIYSQVLNQLRLYLNKEKRSKLLKKEQAKVSKVSTKAPEQMTLMERLQSKVYDETIKVVSAQPKKTQSPQHKELNRKKLKLSAGKNISISK